MYSLHASCLMHRHTCVIHSTTYDFGRMRGRCGYKTRKRSITGIEALLDFIVWFWHLVLGPSLWGRHIAGRGVDPQLGQGKCSGRDIAQMSDAPVVQGNCFETKQSY
jgi:hypothetical protein